MKEYIVLDLSQHCIETATARAHRRLVRAQLEAEALLGTEQQLGLLQDFLRQTDFTALRSKQPKLCGGWPIKVMLQRTPSGSISWTVIEPPNTP